MKIGKRDVFRAVGTGGVGGAIGAATYGTIGGVGVTAIGTGIGITLGPFICIGVGMGLTAYGLVRLGQQIGRPQPSVPPPTPNETATGVPSADGQIP